MGRAVAFFGMLLGEGGVLKEASLFRTRPNHVHTYFIKYTAAEYAIPKPDGNLTRLSPHVRESGPRDYYGKRPYQPRAWFISFVHECRSQTNERGIWPGNETSCAHAYKIRKWRPSQRTAATECCEWLLLTRVNLRL